MSGKFTGVEIRKREANVFSTGVKQSVEMESKDDLQCHIDTMGVTMNRFVNKRPSAHESHQAVAAAPAALASGIDDVLGSPSAQVPLALKQQLDRKMSQCQSQLTSLCLNQFRSQYSNQYQNQFLR